MAVAGFDLTFTLPKSASVLWGLADPPTQGRIAAAHRAAVADTLTFVEERALFTRTGVHSCAQVRTRGMVAAGFEHWDTRSADPNLHTHVVVANKVQGPDGRWRTVDSRALHHAVVAVSELYDNLVADHIARSVPVRWSWRPRGPRRTPAFEIDGIGEDLLAEFSTRSAHIDAAMGDVVAGFHADHGRGPSRVETLRLRQQVTRSTRPAKTTRRLADLIATWQTRATRRTGRSPADITTAALAAGTRNRRAAAQPLRADQVPDTVVERLAGEVIEAVMNRRSTWTRWNLLAETARTTRGLRAGSTVDRVALHDRVTDAAIARCLPLDTPELFAVPEAYRRPDGASVFTRAGEATFTDTRVLAAENRLLAATADTSAPTAMADTARRIATSPVPVAPNAAPVRLAPDQVDAVLTIATSGRRVDVLVGPAGTGKTTTLRALRAAWETSHGRGSVIGLAPSATAAAELGAALTVECENTAKWLHESTGPAAQGRADILSHLTARRTDAAGHGDVAALRRIDTATTALTREQRRWQLRPGQLLILDEASLAGTFTLDTLTAQAGQAGAKVLLVGDHHQLSAIEAGGAFGLLAATGAASELTSLWRFRRRWEAGASRRLRHGDPTALDLYAAHQRIRGGPAEAMLEAAYTDWRVAEQAGRSAILLAADTHTVDALNARAHQDRINGGLVAPTGVPAADQQIVCVGDRVVTRRNERRIPVPGRGHLRNGALWNVSATHPDGSLTLTPASRHTPRTTTSGTTFREPVRVCVPASYVRDHIELGYATTVHRAQGITVEQTHVLAAPGMTRQGLYVAMTRGRAGNHLYVATDAVDPLCDQIPDPAAQHTAGEILTRILTTDATELSATQTLRARQDEAASLTTLAPIRATLIADADHRRWARLLPTCGLDQQQTRQVLHSPAAGALFAALRAGEADGHPMASILRSLAAGRSLQGVDDLAAVLHQRVTRWLDDTDPPEYDHLPWDADGPSTTALLGAGHIDPNDPNHPVLTEIDALIRTRVQTLTLDATQTRPEWSRPLGDTPPGQTDGKRWRQCVAMVCAYRDLTGTAGSTDPTTLGPDSSRDDTDRRRRRIASHAAATAHRLGHPEHDRSLQR